jgi:hypothetical protein
VQRVVAPECFANTVAAARYLLCCDACGDAYCDTCANLSFALRTARGNYLCTPCARDWLRAPSASTSAAATAAPPPPPPQQQQSLFIGWSVSFNVTNYDVDRRIQNRTTTLPVIVDTLLDAKRAALRYVRHTLRNTLDRHTLEALVEQCTQHLEDGKNVAPRCLSQEVFNVDAVDNDEHSQSVRCVLIFTPLRSALVDAQSTLSAPTSSHTSSTTNAFNK